MNSDEIRKILKNYKIFKGVCSRDNIPKNIRRPAAFIVNTDNKYGYGEHWVAILLLTGNRGEYFDPFGLPVLHQDFSDYLDSACSKGWLWNNLALQSADDSSCGSWCIAYIKARAQHLSLVDFLLSNSKHLILNNTK